MHSFQKGIRRRRKEYKRYLILERLLPVSLLFLLYLIDVATDIAVGVQLCQIKGARWSCYVTFTFLLLPILVYNFYEAVMTRNFTLKVLVTRIAELFLCPLLVLLRFVERLFWILEAVSVPENKERQLAETKSAEPRRIELYLFLQPLLQAAPQAFLQMVLLIYIGDVAIRGIQVLCILSSFASLATFAASYHRYESQESNKFLWKYQDLPAYDISDNTDEEVPVDPASPKVNIHVPTASLHSNEIVIHNCANPQEQTSKTFTVSNERTLLHNDLKEISSDDDSSTAQQDICKNDIKSINVDQECEQSSSSEDVPPLPPRTPTVRESPARPPSKHNVGTTSVSRNSSAYYLHVSVSESNRSSDTMTLTVPDFPAPLAPTIPTTSPEVVKLPTRKESNKFITNDSPVGFCVIWLSWFLFISSRVITIGGLTAVILIRKQQILVLSALIVTTLIHFLIMTFVVNINTKQVNRSIFRSCIVGLISLFCLVELKVKFEKSTRILVIYWPLCLLENIAAGFISYRPDQTTNIDNWWFIYLFYTSVSNYIMSIACFIFYKVFFSPKKYFKYY